MCSLRISTRNQRTVFAACLLLLLVITCIPNARSASPEVPSNSFDLNGTKVAIYGGAGVLGSSRDALKNMFLWMNASVSIVYAFQILNGTLDSYDIVVFPGGSAPNYYQGLGTEGLDIIREFVRNGGSYFGICGGSFFGTDAALHLFNGSYSNSINGSSICLTTLNVNQNSTGPDLSDEPESYRVMYWGSAYFYGDMSNVIPICTYPSNGRPAMIAFPYGDGTVFLSSPHPEYEEGAARDGDSTYDYLNDPDTEWNLLLKVSRWLVDASESQSEQDGFPISPYFILGAVGFVGLILVTFTYLTKFRKI